MLDFRGYQDEPKKKKKTNPKQNEFQLKTKRNGKEGKNKEKETKPML